MAERSFVEEVKKLRLGDGEVFRGEGILAVTKALLESGVVLRRRLPGRADLAPDGRAGRRPGHPRRARHPLRELGQRGHRGGHARRLGQLPAARRGHVQGPGRHQRRVRRARQPRLGRRHRRRARDRRRRLRRRLLDHAGAQPRVRDEVADLAARPAAEPAVDRRGGEGRLRALRGEPHAGDADAAHPRLPRARPLRRRAPTAPQRSRSTTRSTTPRARHQPHRAAAGELPARAGEGRTSAGPRRCASSRSDELNEFFAADGARRHRHHRPGRHLQHRCCARSSGSASPTSTAARRSRST